MTASERLGMEMMLDGGQAHSLAFLFMRCVICVWLNGLGSVYTRLSRVKGKAYRATTNRLTSLV